MDNSQPFHQFLNSVLKFFLKLSLFMLLAILALVISGFVMPYIMPNLTSLLIREDNKLFWYFSRGSAIIGYILLWLSTVMGLLVTTKAGKTFPGLKTSSELHQYVSILGLFFTGFHALLLLGDAFLRPNLFQLLIPFAFTAYYPFFVGIGQTVFYVWAFLLFTFYVKKLTGHKIWRGLHYLGFMVFFAGMVHGVSSGTDTALPLMQFIYLFTGASVIFLTTYRLLKRLSVSNFQAEIERE
jgi:predicted ferric reductase